MTQKRVNWAVYILLAFGVLISGPRFSGAFASALGIDLIGLNPIYAVIEINSGWALALFEAVAIAYIAHRFRQIQVLDPDTSQPLDKRILPANGMYWLLILIGQIVLLLSIPAVSTVHLATQTFKTGNEAAPIPDILTITHIWDHFLVWAWLFLTSAASTLFVFLIGLVMEDFGILTRSNNQDAVIWEHYNRLRKTLPIVDPYALSKAAKISAAEAAEFLDSITPAALQPMSTKDRLNALKGKNNNGA